MGNCENRIPKRELYQARLAVSGRGVGKGDADTPSITPGGEENEGRTKPRIPVEGHGSVVMQIEVSGCFIENRIPAHYIKRDSFWGGKGGAAHSIAMAVLLG